MRIVSKNTDRAKAAAKLLVRESGTTTLSTAQQAIAKASGYRDWHELHVSGQAGGTGRSPKVGDWQALILSVCDELGVSHGDAQYALTRARIVPDLPLADALAIRASIWRERLFGPPGRGRPGTVVRVKAHGATRHAYLATTGRPTRVLYDTGFGICADFEAVTPRVAVEDFVPSRLWLPYGFWTVADGSTVTFSRDYKPMWKTTSGATERLDPWLRVKDIRAETHFLTIAGTLDWSRGRARELALGHLADNRIVGLPRLLDAMPHCLVPGVEAVGQAVARMRDANRSLAA